MSVLIRGMEMPTRCWDCLLNTYGYCMASEHSDIIPSDAPIPDWCPLVPIPPHGDLIDRDAERLNDEIFKLRAFKSRFDIKEMLDAAAVVVPAEEGET